MYKVVQTSRLYEQIVQQIEDSIMQGALKPGDQLPAERDLAQQFGVSRTAVREAVKTLREKGLLEAYSGRGTFITDGTSENIRQSLDRMIKMGQPEGSLYLAEVRAILEPEIAALAATSKLIAPSRPSTSPSSSTTIFRQPACRWSLAWTAAWMVSFGITLAKLRLTIG